MSILIKVPSVNDFSGSKSTRIVLTGNAMENPLKKMDQFTVPMATRGKTILDGRVRTKFWTTIGLRKEPFYVFKRTKEYSPS